MAGIDKVTSKQFKLTLGAIKWHKNQLFLALKEQSYKFNK